MISGYLHLTNRKDQFGAIWAPFGVMTLFGSIFFTQIFFLPKFFLIKYIFFNQIYFFYPNFFLPKFFFFIFLWLFFFFFFCKFFLTSFHRRYRWIECMLHGWQVIDIQMMHVTTRTTLFEIYKFTGDDTGNSDMLHVATSTILVLYILIR